jgi:hypothetical protein
MDANLANFLNQLDLLMLWEHPEHWALQDVTTQGVTHRDCVCDQARLNADCPITESRYEKPSAKSTAQSVAQVEVEGGDI